MTTTNRCELSTPEPALPECSPPTTPTTPLPEVTTTVQVPPPAVADAGLPVTGSEAAGFFLLIGLLLGIVGGSLTGAASYMAQKTYNRRYHQ